MTHLRSPLWTRWLLVVALACGGFGLGCQREDTSPVRVGLNAWPGYEFLYLAQEKGFFRDEGVDVRLVEYSSLPDALNAYRRGQIDAFGCTLVEVIMARSHPSRKPSICYVADVSTGADMILAQPHLTSLPELKGRKIGVELGSLGTFILARALGTAGLTLADVALHSSDQLSMEATFQRGELDAIVTYPPVSIRLSKERSQAPLFTSAQIPGEVVDVIAIDDGLLAARPQAARAIVRAYARAVAYYRAQPTEAAALMAHREGITPAEFIAALTEGMSLPAPEDQASLLSPLGTVERAYRAAEKSLLDTHQLHDEPDASSPLHPLTL